MKLEYSMLWFDDDKDQFDSYDFENLVAEINSWGFDFDGPMHVQTPEEFAEKDPFDAFDLIVVDYDIGEVDKHGDYFIRKVRDQKVYTEIVFYTAGKIDNLWDGVKEKHLEGVFLSGKEGIIQKVTRVARQSVKKVLDLENMRGIVMAQVGDMDNIMKDILKAGLAQIKEEELAVIYRRFIKRERKSIEKACVEVKKFSECPPIEKMLNICDSSHSLWLLAKELIRRHPDLRSSNISKYKKEILQPRNMLAHGVPQNQEEGVQFFVHKGEEFKYSEQSAKTIRKNLRKYRDIYKGLLNQVHSKSGIQ